MHDDLVFFAASRSDHNTNLLDKYLDGYATVQFTPTGGVEVGYDETFYEMVNGPWFWPAHPGVRLRFRPANGHVSWPHRHVGFRGALVQEWRDAGLWLEVPQAAPGPRDGAAWDEHFTNLQRLSKRTDSLGRRRAINALENLLLELADARREEALEDTTRRVPWLGQFIERITVHPQGENSIPDYAKLAREFNLSEATLRRRFKEAMGVSPHTYLLRSRADAARVLLAETDLPLKSIAARLGYDNEYFFSRQFKQVTGVAPGTFRRSTLRTG